jgi:hypothetical protein
VEKHTQTSKKVTVALWIVQGLLALLFMFAGGVKLVMFATAARGLLHALAAIDPLERTREIWTVMRRWYTARPVTTSRT